MRDALGLRGEALFVAMITTFHGRTPLFRAQFLGDKWPTVDFFVELLGVGSIRPYFFVQVRTTRGGYTKKESRLKIKLIKDEIRQMTMYPAPTYVVGIDDLSERGFIVSANESVQGPISSICTQYPLDAQHRQLLWNEVAQYWRSQTRKTVDSSFVDPRWR